MPAQALRVLRLDPPAADLELGPDDLEGSPDDNGRIIHVRVQPEPDPAPEQTAMLPMTAQSELSVSELFDWYNQRWIGRKAPATQDSIRAAQRRFALTFGDRPARDLTTLDLQQWIDSHGGACPRTIAARLSPAFSQAMRHGKIPDNPWPAVEIDGSAEDTGRPIHFSEWRRLIAAARGRRMRMFRALLRLAYLVGPRPMELSRLQRRHVQLDRHAVVLSADEHKTGRRTRRPRTIVLDNRAQRLVAATLTVIPQDQQYIFVNEDGQPWIDQGKKSSLSKKFARLRQRAGLPPDITLYALRHAYGTRLAMTEGITPSLGAQLMGNSPKMFDRYVHLAGEIGHLVEAANAAARKRLGVTASPPHKRPGPRGRDLPGQRRMFAE